MNAVESSWVQRSACLLKRWLEVHGRVLRFYNRRPRHEAKQSELDDVDGHIIGKVLEERVRAEERSADSAAILAAGGV